MSNGPSQFPQLNCPGCGYDLRGAQADGEGKLRCPECGAAGTTEQLRQVGASAAERLSERWGAMFWPAWIVGPLAALAWLATSLLSGKYEGVGDVLAGVTVIVLLAAPFGLLWTIWRNMPSHAPTVKRIVDSIGLLILYLVLNAFLIVGVVVLSVLVGSMAGGVSK